MIKSIVVRFKVPLLARKLFFSLLFVMGFVFGINTLTAYAHTPHDVIFSFALSPAYEQDNTIYLVTRGNLLKSVDNGANWALLINGIDADQGLNDVAISPDDKNELYLSSTGNGVYKSIDGGSSWQLINDGLQSLQIQHVIVSEHNVVFAIGADGGLYQKESTQDLWQLVIDQNTQISSVGFSPFDSSVIAAGDFNGNVYLSNDGGTQFEACCEIGDAGAITAVTFSPIDESQNTFYLGTSAGGVFVTNDQGQTLEPLNQGLTDISITSMTAFTDSNDQTSLWVSTWNTGVYQLNLESQEWQLLNEQLRTNEQANAPHYLKPQFSQLIFSEDKTEPTIFLGSFTGLYQLKFGEEQWSKIQTLAGKIIIDHELSPDFKNDGMIIVTTYTSGAYIVDNEGSRLIHNSIDLFGLYQEEQKLRFHNAAFSPNYIEDGTIFISANNFLLKSTDRGETWDEVSLSEDYWWGHKLFGSKIKNYLPALLELSTEFATDQTLFIGTIDGFIFRSTDGGESLEIVHDFGDIIDSLKMSPNYIADQTLFVSKLGDGVSKSTDGGTTWEFLNEGLESIDKRIILAVSPNFANDQTVYAGTVDGLFKSENEGQSWLRIECTPCGESPHISSIVLSPDYGNDQTIILGAQGMGLFKSEAGVEDFVQIDSSLTQNGAYVSFYLGFPPTDGYIELSQSYHEDKLISGKSNTELLLSYDDGRSWESVELYNYTDDINIFVDIISRDLLFRLILLILGVLLIPIAIYTYTRRDRIATLLPKSS